MLQNVAVHNLRVPKRNVQRHKTYTITKWKVHITEALQNVCMFCGAINYVTFMFWHLYVLYAYGVCSYVK